MDTRIGEDRIGRDLRRYQLARRLIAHGARTQTIVDWTALTRQRLKTLRREWRVPPEERHRGPSPTALSVFFRSPRMRSEAASLSVLCRILGAVPSQRIPNAARHLPNLGGGERLCDVFEAYRTYFPSSEIGFEQLVLLALGLAQREAIELGNCKTCDGMILIDRLAVSRRICSHCQRIGGHEPSAAQSATGEAGGDADEESPGYQRSLF